MEDLTKALAEMALNRWQELAFRNCSTDILVNDLLQRIAGEKYDDYEELDNPIVTIIYRLTTDELIDFLSGCKHIDYSDRGQT